MDGVKGLLVPFFASGVIVVHISRHARQCMRGTPWKHGQLLYPMSDRSNL